MRLFRREEEDFDDSAAFESDNSGVIKIVFGVIFLTVIVVIMGFVAYNQYQIWIVDDSNQSTLTDKISDIIKRNTSEEIIINFTDFNLTVKENPGGIYYFTTQDKVVGEDCYINGRRKSCKSLTNKVCSEEECTKELEIIKECFVNSEKIDCPE